MKRTKMTLLSLILAVGFFGCGQSVDEVIGEQAFRFPAPAELSGTSKYHAVELTWEAVEDAEFYVVFYGQDMNLEGGDARQGNSGDILTDETSIILPDLTTGVDYHFAVAAGGSLGKLDDSILSDMVTVKPHNRHGGDPAPAPGPNPIK